MTGEQVTYKVVKEYEGKYLVIDEWDGETVATVAKFLPGPMVYVRGQQGMYSPELALAVARAMRRLARDLRHA